MFRLIFKILTSKKTRKVAKKAVKVAKKNVKVKVSDRGLDVTVMKRKTFRVDADTFKRESTPAETPAAIDWSSVPRV
jgi:hypothetical protein